MRRFVFILLLALMGDTAVIWAQAPTRVPTTPAAVAAGAGAASDVAPRVVRLLVGHSAIVDMPTPITRVSLTSSDIADALVTTSQQLLVHGKVPGTISMFVWDKGGAIQRYEVRVERDLAILNAQVRDLFPNEHITAESNGKSIVVSGLVSSKETADKAVAVAAGYVDKKDDVVNLLQVQTGASQVLLHVRFAEVSRSAITELGASWFTGPGGFHDYVSRVTTQQFAAPDFKSFTRTSEQGADKFGGGRDTVTSTGGESTFSDFLNFFLFNNKYNVGTLIRAMQERGLFQSLAEPNLIAENGKEASFLAGGQLPIPVVQGGNQFTSVTIEWKEFGIRLNFTPTIIGNNLVDLKVTPEVSTLDFSNAITLQGFRIPALSTRRTDTQVQLTNGQTFAIAGLINNQVSSTMRKVPGIGDIPILGLLFQSKAAQKDRTELVVMITPEILSPTSPGVTDALPRTPEQFLPQLPDKKTKPVPPPAFAPERPGAALAQPAPVQAKSAPPSQAAEAAAAVRALTPKGPTTIQPASLSAQPAAASAPASSVPAAAAPPQHAASAVPAMTKKQLDEQRKLEAKQHEEQDKAARAQAKRDAEQAKRDAEVAKRVAEMKARADAEAKKKADEAAKKQAEQDREQQKKVDEAAAKLKAAQDAYNAQLAKQDK